MLLRTPTACRRRKHTRVTLDKRLGATSCRRNLPGGSPLVLIAKRRSCPQSNVRRCWRRFPTFITELTGISQLDVDRDGHSRQDALNEFLGFIGNRPVFFHNSPFDVSFLERAMQQSGLRFSNLVHDTLPVARAAWPQDAVTQIGNFSQDC
ncbi:3'-5' exonuclease [Massilia phyllosphaerae]|uniref:3'-5' exonuclease n=1 Tax=Massilia phyllosphaerae TaxID=3106034 RepID=UPI0035C91DE6